jgi:hypothetical protein
MTLDDQSNDNGFDDWTQISEKSSGVNQDDRDCELVGEPPDRIGGYLRANLLDEYSTPRRENCQCTVFLTLAK